MLYAMVSAVILNFVSGYYFSSWLTKKLGLSDYQSWGYYKGVLFSPLLGMVTFLWFASLGELWAILLGVFVNLLIPPAFLSLIWLVKSLYDKIFPSNEEDY